jgi:cytochrome c biogenesis protein CcmG/thiol:disulfide interchange protein DsbE
MSRRTVFSLVLLLLAGSWFVVTGLIRAHVDDLIQHSVGKPMPEFALADRAGKVWTTADLKGKRAVLHFFRSRCHSCDLEAPAILELEAALPADTVLLHVMTDAVLDFPTELTTETIAKKSFQRPVLLADAKFVDAFHTVNWSNVTPITYVVDPAGVIRFGLRGAQTRAAVEEALAAAR